jgi:hypothetical protein
MRPESNIPVSPFSGVSLGGMLTGSTVGFKGVCEKSDSLIVLKTLIQIRNEAR